MQHFGSTSKIVDKAEVPPFMSPTSKVVRMEQLVVISFETLPEGQVFEKQLSISCLRRLEHPDWNVCTDAFPNHWPLLKLCEAGLYASVWDMFMVLLQTQSSALNFNGIAVSLGIPPSLVFKAQNCSLIAWVLQKGILWQYTVFTTENIVSHFNNCINNWES